MPSFYFSTLLTAIAIASALVAPQLHAQTAFPATLAGHVVMPAQSFIAVPEDAPADFQVSDKFTTGKRVETLGTVEGLSAGRPTGMSVPFKGQAVRSPDNPAVAIPDAPGGTMNFQVRRSKGFEGMAASKDGSKLYALLEGALWTGRHWKYVLEANSHAIGDFNMIDGTTGLILERDNGEGTADKA